MLVGGRARAEVSGRQNKLLADGVLIQNIDERII